MIPSYFQTDAWGKFKSGFGWTAGRYQNWLGLKRALFMGRSMLYFPELPYSTESSAKIANIIEAGTPPKVIFTRFEFFAPWSEQAAAELRKLELAKSFEEVQPEYRQWVSLEGSEEEILDRMKPKGRYNIRVAERHNLEVKAGMTEKLLSDFFDLYSETSRRSKFSGRGPRYFQDLANLLSERNQGEIIAVYHRNRPLAAGIFLYYGPVASYLYGASGGDRSLMAPYLMHWEAMKRAKSRGCQTYDLLAIAPPDSSNTHPYASLTRFKAQFGGQSVRLLGSWDLINNRFWYTLYRFAQRRRRKIAR